MEFICPACEKKLNKGYLIINPIKVNDHPGGKCAKGGIGQKGIVAHLLSKKQQKTQASALGSAAAKAKKENKSVANLNTYQTPLKDAAKQQAREQKARDVGLKGHGSSNSNAGQNNATTGGLTSINKEGT